MESIDFREISKDLNQCFRGFISIFPVGLEFVILFLVPTYSKYRCVCPTVNIINHGFAGSVKFKEVRFRSEDCRIYVHMNS